MAVKAVTSHSGPNSVESTVGVDGDGGGSGGNVNGGNGGGRVEGGR